MHMVTTTTVPPFHRPAVPLCRHVIRIPCHRVTITLATCHTILPCHLPPTCRNRAIVTLNAPLCHLVRHGATRCATVLPCHVVRHRSTVPPCRRPTDTIHRHTFEYLSIIILYFLTMSSAISSYSLLL